MAWKKYLVKTEWTTVKCEVCGHVFKEGEVAWRRIRAEPRGTRNKRKAAYKDIFRCQKCYELMWH